MERVNAGCRVIASSPSNKLGGEQFVACDAMVEKLPAGVKDPSEVQVRQRRAWEKQFGLTPDQTQVDIGHDRYVVTGQDFSQVPIGEDKRVRGDAVPLLKGDFRGQLPVNPLPGYKPAREGFIDWLLKPFKHQ
jgi:hypothetical protein